MTSAPESFRRPILAVVDAGSGRDSGIDSSFGGEKGALAGEEAGEESLLSASDIRVAGASSRGVGERVSDRTSRGMTCGD